MLNFRSQGVVFPYPIFLIFLSHVGTPPHHSPSIQCIFLAYRHTFTYTKALFKWNIATGTSYIDFVFRLEWRVPASFYIFVRCAGLSRISGAQHHRWRCYCFGYSLASQKTGYVWSLNDFNEKSPRVIQENCLFT